MQRQPHRKPKYLNSSVQAYQKIDQFHKTVDGLNIFTKRLFPMNEENLLEGHEICDVTTIQFAHSISQKNGCFELKINARSLHGTIHQLAKP